MIKKLLVLSLVLLSIGCHAKNDQEVKQNNRGTNMQDFMDTKTWKTFCTGRYLIDLPTGLEPVVTGTDWIMKDEFVWEQGIKNSQQFVQQIEKIKNNLRNSKHPISGSTLSGREDGRSYFVKEIKYKNGGIGILVMRSAFGSGMQLYNYFVTEQPFRVFSYKNEFVRDSNMDEILLLNSTLANSLQSRDETEIPKGPGICVRGGFIAGNHQNLKETTNIWLNYPYYSKKYVFQIGLVDDVTKEPMTLHPKERFPNVKVKKTLLNSSNTIVAGLKGKEYGINQEASIAEEGIPYYSFDWYYPGKANSSLDPHIAVSMGYLSRDYKEDVVAPEYLMFTNDKQAITLWQNVLNSIRKRPE